MTIDTILSRLDGVKQTGHGKFVAHCPAHDDRSPSLAISEGDNDTVLLHCFTGCETEDVLSAVGLTFSDLYPERICAEHHGRPKRTSFDARQVLATLDHESLVVALIGADFIKRNSLDEPTWQRLATAVNRINSARAQAAPLQFKKWHRSQLAKNETSGVTEDRKSA